MSESFFDTAGIPPFPPGLGKAEAIIELCRRAGLTGVNPWDASSASLALTRLREILRPFRNENAAFSTAAQLSLHCMPIHNATSRPLDPAIFTNGRPACFGDGRLITAFSPDFKILSIRNGYVGHFFGAPLIVADDGHTIVEDFSSHYSELSRYYDFDLSGVAREARFIDGIVIPIADDVRPLNYCHWLIDWLPRLEFLGFHAYKPSLYVVTTPLIARFQRDSLRMCGFDDSRVIALDDFQAIRARELLVPSDLRDIPHPIHKGAPWALSYLRSSVGLGSIKEVGYDSRRSEKLYVSRADAAGRRIVNDAELAVALEKFGYRRIELSHLPISQQIASFMYASHIIGLHGAGLSNIAFVMPSTKIIEVFPESYGILSFYVVAASVGCSYATYIADRTVPGAIAQYDDVEIDISRFLEACGHLI